MRYSCHHQVMIQKGSEEGDDEKNSIERTSMKRNAWHSFMFWKETFILFPFEILCLSLVFLHFSFSKLYWIQMTIDSYPSFSFLSFHLLRFDLHCIWKMPPAASSSGKKGERRTQRHSYKKENGWQCLGKDNIYFCPPSISLVSFGWSQRNSYLKSILSTESSVLDTWMNGRSQRLLLFFPWLFYQHQSLSHETGFCSNTTTTTFFCNLYTCSHCHLYVECEGKTMSFLPKKLDFFHLSSLVLSRGIRGRRNPCGNNVSKINIYIDFIYNPDNLTRGKRERERNSQVNHCHFKREK